MPDRTFVNVFAFLKVVCAFYCCAHNRAQQDQKPVSRRPVCYVPPLREECAALQLCAKCGAISQGRLDWQDIDEADTGREAVGAAAVVKATTDISGEKEDEIVASSGESATDMADKPDSEEDAIMHRIFDRTIFDRILGGGVGRELQPGSGSHRFYCTKCWRCVKRFARSFISSFG